MKNRIERKGENYNSKSKIKGFCHEQLLRHSGHLLTMYITGSTPNVLSYFLRKELIACRNTTGVDRNVLSSHFSSKCRTTPTHDTNTRSKQTYDPDARRLRTTPTDARRQQTPVAVLNYEIQHLPPSLDVVFIALHLFRGIMLMAQEGFSSLGRNFNPPFA